MPTNTQIEYCKQPLQRLFQYLKYQNNLLNKSIFFSTINKLFDLAPPLLVGWAVDAVSKNSPAFISNITGGEPWPTVLLLGAFAIVIFGLESVFEWLYAVGFMRLAQRIQDKLRIDAYTKMQSRELAFFENHRVGETMSMLNDDINQLERFISTVFNDIVQIIALVLIAGGIMLYHSPQLTLVAVLPLPLIVWGSLRFQKRLGPFYQKIRSAVGALNSRLENNLSGIVVIKSFTAESTEIARIASVSADYKSRNIDAVKYSALFTPLIRMGVVIGFAGVIVFGGLWTLEGIMTPGEYTLFGMMCQRILWPLTRLGQILDETERCKASGARIFGLLDSSPTIADADNAVDVPRFKGSIALRNVCFNYKDDLKILNDINLEIQPGELIGVAGATGSGKSTLIKLLLRLYEPQKGQILIDGNNIDHYTLHSLRRNIALVPQDVYVLHGTIAENICYGSPTASTEQIQQAAQAAQLHEYIASLPQRYNTIIGERGIKLSGGQRQRLSIARALLKDAPILILDEATSSVDTETERAIQTGLSAFTQNRTSIVIAHRLSTIRNASRIVVLKQGTIIEVGTHDELLRSAGCYADLWNLQQGGTTTDTIDTHLKSS